MISLFQSLCTPYRQGKLGPLAGKEARNTCKPLEHSPQ